jgi:hypothetical protein
MKNMSILIRALCAATALSSLAACGSATAQAPAGGSRSVPISEHQTVTLAPALTLRYDSVADSRCPKSVQCVVAGKVTHSFTLSSNSAQEVFTLDKQGTKFESTAVPGVTVALASDPVPETPSAAHAVVLDVNLK